MDAHRLGLVVGVAVLSACAPEPEPDGRGEQVGYRTGVRGDDFTSNGERGNVNITEIFWTGSVRGDEAVHDPDDVFIELQNKHPRPIHLTGWLLTIEVGRNLDGQLEANTSGIRDRVTYVIPAREGGQAVEPNGFVVMAAKRDGAFREADYYVESLRIPRAPFDIELRDLDERLMDHVGDDRKPAFAGSWDKVTSRSMERVQVIFGNRGGREAAWHTYSLNDYDTGLRGELHLALRAKTHEEYRLRTFATPGLPNSPDYSGTVSSGSFE